MEKEKIKLEVEGVYKTNVKDLVKIQRIDEKRGKLILYNITDNCHQEVDIKNHRLVTKVR